MIMLIIIVAIRTQAIIPVEAAAWPCGGDVCVAWGAVPPGIDRVAVRVGDAAPATFDAAQHLGRVAAPPAPGTPITLIATAREASIISGYGRTVVPWAVFMPLVAA